MLECFPEGEDSSREGSLASRSETDRRSGVVSTRRIRGAEGAEGRTKDSIGGVSGSVLWSASASE